MKKSYAHVGLWVAVIQTLVNAPAFAATQLVLNWKAEPEFGGFYAAQSEGFFKKHGLDVEIVEGGGGTPVVQMIAANKAEFGIAAADEVIQSRDRDTDIVALFAVYQTNPQGVMVHGKRGFKSIGEMLRAPGTFAIQPGSTFAVHLQKKYPADQIKAKFVPYTGGIGQFLNDANHSQQCFVTAEPLAAKKAGGGGADAQSFIFADEGINPYAVVLVARGAYLDKDPAKVKAFVAAVREGWTAYVRDPKVTERVNRLMQKINPSMDLETFQAISAEHGRQIETAETKRLGIGIMTETRWSTLADQLKELKLIRKPVKSVRDLYRNW